MNLIEGSVFGAGFETQAFNPKAHQKVIGLRILYPLPLASKGMIVGILLSGLLKGGFRHQRSAP